MAELRFRYATALEDVAVFSDAGNYNKERCLFDDLYYPIFSICLYIFSSSRNCSTVTSTCTRFITLTKIALLDGIVLQFAPILSVLVAESML